MMFSIKGGTGTAFLGAGNQINLVLTGADAGSALVIKAAGGDGRVALGDMTVNGSLRNLNARAADLSGTLYASGGIGKLMLGNVSGASIASATSIANITAATFSGSRILAGATSAATTSSAAPARPPTRSPARVGGQAESGRPDHRLDRRRRP